MAGKRRESILDLSKHMEKKLQVEFAGGRIVTGVLKGYDPLVNIVMDDCVEIQKLKDENGSSISVERNLGLIVCRGTNVMVVNPVDS